MEPLLPTGTVTFLFTDMVGSTSLWEQFPEVMPSVLAAHDVIVREIVGAYGGVIFATGGDGVAAAFQRTSDAVSAAVALQRGLSAQPWGRVVPSVRMGIHTGEAHERDGDYFGPVVNRSARLMNAADGGQILVSQVAAALVRSGDGVSLVEVGTVELRGVAEPMRVMGVIAEGVAAPRLAERTMRGNLPAPLTEFVGSILSLEARARELRGTRLVTLTGPGGVGKTRLAIEAASLLTDDFRDGVWFVDLAPVGEGAAVAAAVAQVLGVQLQTAASISESVVEWLLGRRLLLVIDNCEHLLGEAALLIAEILSHCPTVSVLATSREPLGVGGEAIRVVPSLDAAVDGVLLFCDRARRANESFDPDVSDRLVIAEICSRLDGIPLAIELAAARARSLTCQEIRDRLDDRFRLLRGAGRSGVDRHQTIRATVQWSYQLLSGEEQMLFDRLSVFAGSFSLAAAEAVVTDEVLDSLDVVDLMGVLVDKSMVMVELNVTGSRYRLLETLRQFAEERLVDRGEAASHHDRHFDYYLGRATALSKQLEGKEQAVAHEAFVADWDNLRSAFWWALEHRLADEVEQLLFATCWDAVTSTRLEHLEWCAGAMARPDTRTALVLGIASAWEFVRWDFGAQFSLADEGLQLDGGSGAARTCHVQKALALTMFGQRDEADGHFDRALELAVSANDRYAEFWAYLFRCYWAQAFEVGRYDECAAALDAVAERYRAPVMFAAAATVRSAELLWREPPDVATSLALSEAALVAALSVGATTVVGMSRNSLVLGLTRGTEPSHSRRIAQLMREQVDMRAGGVIYPMLQSVVSYLAICEAHEVAATLRGHFDVVGWFPTPFDDLRNEVEVLLRCNPRFEEWRARGAQLSRDEMVVLALNALVQVAGEYST